MVFPQVFGGYERKPYRGKKSKNRGNYEIMSLIMELGVSPVTDLPNFIPLRQENCHRPCLLQGIQFRSFQSIQEDEMEHRFPQRWLPQGIR